jgi:hypothetical protein
MSNPWIEALEGRLSLADAVSLSEDPVFARRAWARLGKWQLLRIVDQIPWLTLAAADAIVQAGVGWLPATDSRSTPSDPRSDALSDARDALHLAFGGDVAANARAHQIYAQHGADKALNPPFPFSWNLIGWGLETLDQVHGGRDQQSVGSGLHILVEMKSGAHVPIIQRLERLPTLLEVMRLADGR